MTSNSKINKKNKEFLTNNWYSLTLKKISSNQEIQVQKFLVLGKLLQILSKMTKNPNNSLKIKLIKLNKFKIIMNYGKKMIGLRKKLIISQMNQIKTSVLKDCLIVMVLQSIFINYINRLPNFVTIPTKINFI